MRFADDAVVRDEGRTIEGPPDIKQWMREAKAKYQHTVEPTEVSSREGKTVVVARVAGNFPNSPLDLEHVFTIEGGEDLVAGDPMSASVDLGGRKALVTGATKGIGQAVVARLRDAGAVVLGTARTPPSDVADGILFVAADVATAEGCAAVVAAVRSRLGDVDIIVHVVGGSSAPAGGFAVLGDEEWRRALDLNLFPAVRLDRALLPMMLARS